MSEERLYDLIKGNFKYQYKLARGIEAIDSGIKTPKYPILILTCMDPRIDIHRIFQLNPGDVFILRNAGNICTVDMIRSMLLAIHNYNIKLIIVLGHLDCGMTKIKIKELQNKLTLKAHKEICSSKLISEVEMRKFFKPFNDEFKNLRDQVEDLLDSKLIPPGVEIEPMLYDIKTGWVFEKEMITNLTYIDEFEKEHKNLLAIKGWKLIDFMDEFEKTIEISPSKEKEKFYEEDNSLELTPAKENSILNLGMSKLGVVVPKINFPKIKIRIPKIERIKVNL